MRRFLSVGLALLLCLSSAEAEIYMRVVARDDSPAAQAEKYAVRAAALAACPDRPAGLLSALPRIARSAKAAAPDSRVSLRLWRPDAKTPAALTVYITVGEAGGHNWWGVLYGDALKLAGEEEGEDICFRWPFLTWIRQLLGL